MKRDFSSEEESESENKEQGKFQNQHYAHSGCEQTGCKSNPFKIKKIENKKEQSNIIAKETMESKKLSNDSYEQRFS